MEEDRGLDPAPRLILRTERSVSLCASVCLFLSYTPSPRPLCVAPTHSPGPHSGPRPAGACLGVPSRLVCTVMEGERQCRSQASFSSSLAQKGDLKKNKLTKNNLHTPAQSLDGAWGARGDDTHPSGRVQLPDPHARPGVPLGCSSSSLPTRPEGCCF